MTRHPSVPATLPSSLPAACFPSAPWLAPATGLEGPRHCRTSPFHPYLLFGPTCQLALPPRGRPCAPHPNFLPRNTCRLLRPCRNGQQPEAAAQQHRRSAPLFNRRPSPDSLSHSECSLPHLSPCLVPPCWPPVSNVWPCGWPHPGPVHAPVVPLPPRKAPTPPLTEVLSCSSERPTQPPLAPLQCTSTREFLSYRVDLSTEPNS
jgi:hypothetical protein